MKCEVKYFGLIGEKLKKNAEEIDVEFLLREKNNLSRVFQKLYPELKGLSFSIAVNGEISNVLHSEKVRSIALLPPFAGG